MRLLQLCYFAVFLIAASSVYLTGCGDMGLGTMNFGIPAESITILAPDSGATVKDTVAINVKVVDDATNTFVSDIYLVIDGVRTVDYGSTPSGTTRSCAWPSSSVANGVHWIQVEEIIEQSGSNQLWNWQWSQLIPIVVAN